MILYFFLIRTNGSLKIYKYNILKPVEIIKTVRSVASVSSPLPYFGSKGKFKDAMP